MTAIGADAGFDELAYRRALGGFGTGVALVAAYDRLGQAHGLIINSLTSVSLHPPIVLWCLADSCAAYDVFTTCAAFSINILGADDEALARQFSRRGDRMIPRDQVVAMETGAPVLAAGVASLDCRLRGRDRIGDHDVIYGDVASYRAAPSGDALGYFRGRFLTLSVGD